MDLTLPLTIDDRLCQTSLDDIVLGDRGHCSREGVWHTPVDSNLDIMAPWHQPLGQQTTHGQHMVGICLTSDRGSLNHATCTHVTLYHSGMGHVTIYHFNNGNGMGSTIMSMDYPGSTNHTNRHINTDHHRCQHRQSTVTGNRGMERSAAQRDSGDRRIGGTRGENRRSPLQRNREVTGHVGFNWVP